MARARLEHDAADAVLLLTVLFGAALVIMITGTLLMIIVPVAGHPGWTRQDLQLLCGTHHAPR